MNSEIISIYKLGIVKIPVRFKVTLQSKLKLHSVSILITTSNACCVIVLKLMQLRGEKASSVWVELRMMDVFIKDSFVYLCLKLNLWRSGTENETLRNLPESRCHFCLFFLLLFLFQIVKLQQEERYSDMTSGKKNPLPQPKQRNKTIIHTEEGLRVRYTSFIFSVISSYVKSPQRPQLATSIHALLNI